LCSLNTDSRKEIIKMTKMVMENYLTRFIRYLIDWRKTRKIIRHLQSLDDRTLKDIGVERYAISKLAYTKVQKDRNEKQLELDLK
jgi:uncharacterized protein YjiS (DUF1127 family)